MASGDRGADSDLVNGCVSGSERAWIDFYRQYHSIIEAVVRRQERSATRDVREDFIQEVYRSLVEALPEYDGRSSSLRTFVSMVAQRTCIDCWRGRSTMSRTGHTEPIEHHDNTDKDNVVIACGVDPPDEQMAGAESRALLKAALGRLSETCQELLRLRFFSDLTYEEIGDRLGKRANSVNVGVLRCIAHLRAAYAMLETREQRT
jgi:RNA polymerase sigma factor (sigma-70 family)